jgi:short-subunit dehydrogenase
MAQPEVVVITGAAAGVGRAVVRAFAKRGASIGLLSRSKAALEAARSEVEQAGGRAIALPTDVADPARVEAAAEEVENAFGPIDIWINDAMATVFSFFKDIDPEEFKRATEVTYLGTVYGTRSALKRMLPRNHGKIVQVGSALAYRSVPLQSAYCGAKSAIRGFTDAVRTELIHMRSDVHITMVQMPALNTPQFSWARTKLEKTPRPIAPVYQPEVAAEAIYWAAHNRRRELYVGISSAAIIVANKFMAGALDHYMARIAVSGQQTGRLVEEDRQDNLYSPVEGRFAAHGHFDKEAMGRSPQLKAAMFRNWIVAGAIALGAAGLGIYAANRS